MKNMLLAVFCVIGVMLLAQTGAHQNAFTPDQIKYGPVPPFIAPGAQLAVVEGNPGADSGDFTVRLKMPDGYKIAPHWHPKRENITVYFRLFQGRDGRQMGRREDDDLSAGQLCLHGPGDAPLRPVVGRDRGSGPWNVAAEIHLRESGRRSE
jgi:hypothetical protein